MMYASSDRSATFFCHFRSFFALLPYLQPQKFQCHIFLGKEYLGSYDVCFLRYGVQHFFCHFRPFFALLPYLQPQKLKFGENIKNSRRCYPFTHVHHNLRSYDGWFLKYKAHQTVFCHFGPFFALWPPENQIFEKIKKAWWYYHFIHV